MDTSSDEGSAGECCCAWSICSMKLVELMSKAIKLSLTELVGQYRNILPLALSALTSIRSFNTENATGKYSCTDIPLS